ncbi:MAG: formylglycine-generating enzyme family protein [Candidatus Brocadiia bacterium]
MLRPSIVLLLLASSFALTLGNAEDKGTVPSPIALVAISPGSYFMGSERSQSEGPVHRVNISHAFQMAATEVTQGQYRVVMKENPSRVKGDEFPVQRVSWKDAMKFCRLLTAAERKVGRLPDGFEYRLPTEAEWEYCCRAGSTAKYSFGDDGKSLGEYAWFGANSEGRVHPAGTRKPNAWGLFDMHGNVEEWCLDAWGEYPPGTAERTDPIIPCGGDNKRVARGGSFCWAEDDCTSAARRGCFPGSESIFALGFRVVLASGSVAEEIEEAQAVEVRQIRLVSIPPGSFLMGSEKGDDDEKPVHRVNISHAFSMAATEVTQAQYRAVMDSDPSNFRGDDLPIERISWYDAKEYCLELTKAMRRGGKLPDGMEYRLPTAAEWEYCCRAGSTTEYCFGDDENLLGGYAWFEDNSEGKTHRVGTKRPNAWGLYDMHGNVWEWCLDWYSYADGYPGGEQTDPFGPAKGDSRTLRGGSWDDAAFNCRSADLDENSPRYRNDYGGFRVVLAPEIVPAVLCSYTFVPIEPGSFLMGSEEGDKNEKPLHRVNISRAFSIGATEITQEQYREVMNDTPSEFRGDALPVEGVSWNLAMEFCRLLTKAMCKAGNLPDGMKYRLPTEAEWEYCCRAGSTAKFCFGDDARLLCEYAWFRDNSKYEMHPAGTRKPNAWGLYDMHGNVWEWCYDRYSDVYPGEEQTDPSGPAKGKCRVLRGGSWSYPASSCRSSSRIADWPVSSDWRNGFRVVLGPVIEVK